MSFLHCDWIGKCFWLVGMSFVCQIVDKMHYDLLCIKIVCIFMTVCDKIFSNIISNTKTQNLYSRLVLEV